MDATIGKVRFGYCTLDNGRGILIGRNGVETLLRPKTLEVLRFLLRNPARVVTRDEILSAVWPELYVSDNSIAQCVAELRKAMGEVGTSILRTVPRRGYLLEAEIRIEPAPSPVLDLSRIDRPSIAVLPFRKDSVEMGEAYFADGIVEGIVHVLSGLERIAVVSRGSALAVAESTVDPREVGRRLGVRYVLYGGVLRSAGRLRITTELADAESGTIVRTDRHDGDASDLFELQDRIAEQIVTTLAPQVRERELARALRKTPASLTAYDLMLRALDRLHRLDRASFAEARRLLEKAIETDPTFVPAHSYLAWWYTLGIAQGWSEDLDICTEAAAVAAAAALELDPDDALALTLRGVERGYLAKEYELAVRLVDRAVVRSPSCALAWSVGGALRCWLEQGSEAVAWAERGVRLAPRDPFAFFHEHILSQAHDTARNHGDALLWAQRCITLNPLHFPSWRVLVVSLAALGRSAEARDAASRVLELEPDFRVGTWAGRTPLRGATRIRFAEHLRQAGLPE